jgi:hypothetical protein
MCKIILPRDCIPSIQDIVQPLPLNSLHASQCFLDFPGARLDRAQLSLFCVTAGDLVTM